jgi:hypothetical protein
MAEGETPGVPPERYFAAPQKEVASLANRALLSLTGPSSRGPGPPRQRARQRHLRDHDSVGQGLVGMMAERAHELGAGNPFHVKASKECPSGENDRPCGPEAGILTLITPRRQKKKTRRVEPAGRSNQVVVAERPGDLA